MDDLHFVQCKIALYEVLLIAKVLGRQTFLLDIYIEYIISIIRERIFCIFQLNLLHFLSVMFTH